MDTALQGEFISHIQQKLVRNNSLLLIFNNILISERSKNLKSNFKADFHFQSHCREQER